MRWFLRIASRIKDEGNRRSEIYKRRFTGAKGIGRLAAHKLAKHMTIRSFPDPDVLGIDARPVEATIDWGKIELCETLDTITADAVTLKEGHKETPGTEIELSKLRRKWTPSERKRVMREVATFRPPEVLVNLPPTVPAAPLLFETMLVRDIVERKDDPGFEVRLLGEFDVGEDYWTAVAQAADWILEIDSERRDHQVHYRITPTHACKHDLPDAEQHDFNFNWEELALECELSLNARILIREGAEGKKKMQRPWLVENAGVKVYMEGFRVLPYGEPGDDWLEIDYDYSLRLRRLRFLDSANLDLKGYTADDEDAALNALRNQAYYGAAFLTSQGTPDLQMLVNREGFIPNAAFTSLQRIIRVGIDLSVRVRALERRGVREDRRQQRREGKPTDGEGAPERLKMREAAEASAQNAVELARKARSAAAAGRHDQAEKLITNAAREIEQSSRYAGELVLNQATPGREFLSPA